MKAEAEFHYDAIYYHLPDHEDDYDPGTVEDKKQKLIGMCDRLISRILQSYFLELITRSSPGSTRRLLNYILWNAAIRLFSEKWQTYIPSGGNETSADFLNSALEFHIPRIEQYYSQSLQIYEKRLSDSLKHGRRCQSAIVPAQRKAARNPGPIRAAIRKLLNENPEWKPTPRIRVIKLAATLQIDVDDNKDWEKFLGNVKQAHSREIQARKKKF
jgi:hypothetical protein